MPNIIRIRNLENEIDLKDIIIPVDKDGIDGYTSNAKQIKIDDLKTYILSGLTFSGGTGGTSGTSGISPCQVTPSDNIIYIYIRDCVLEGEIDCDFIDIGTTTTTTTILVTGSTTTSTTLAPTTTTTTSTTLAPTTTTTTTPTPYWTSVYNNVSFSTELEVCTQPTGLTNPEYIYSSSYTLAPGVIIYTDNTLSNTFNGGNLYWKIYDGSFYGWATLVNSFGVIISRSCPSYEPWE